MLFSCNKFFYVLFLHVFAPRHKSYDKTDIVGEIIPGLSNMLRKKEMTEGESFSVPHVQVILFFTEALFRLIFLSFWPGKSETGDMSRESCRIGFLGGP